jgi:hypothetical protein
MGLAGAHAGRDFIRSRTREALAARRDQGAIEAFSDYGHHGLQRRTPSGAVLHLC